MTSKKNPDNWHWIAVGAGIGVTALLLLLLYAPNGIWKAALLLLVGVALIVMAWNPRFRLFGIGTAAALTGLGGFITELSFNASATLPSGQMFTGGIEGGSDVPPIFFLMLLAIGIITIAFDNVGRGWIWPFVQRNNPAQPNVTFTLERDVITLSDHLALDGQGRFHASLVASKSEGQPVRLVRAEMKDANILEFGVGRGDGVQNSLTIEGASTEISVLGTFPKTELSNGSAKRELLFVDEFGRSWSAGTIELRLPT